MNEGESELGASPSAEAAGGTARSSLDGAAAMVELEAVLGLRAFVETVNDTVYLLRADGVFTYASPNWAELVGEPPTAPLGRSFEHYVHPDDVPACTAYMEALSRRPVRDQRASPTACGERTASGAGTRRGAPR